MNIGQCPGSSFAFANLIASGELTGCWLLTSFERWYDGYLTEDGECRFNLRSVVLALIDDSLRSYWTESDPYDEIYYYVHNNIVAVRDDLVRMVAGEPVRAEMKNYAASSMSLTAKDEIFSAMVVALSGGTALDMMTNTHDSFVN